MKQSLDAWAGQAKPDQCRAKKVKTNKSSTAQVAPKVMPQKQQFVLASLHADGNSAFKCALGAANTLSYHTELCLAWHPVTLLLSVFTVFSRHPKLWCIQLQSEHNLLC
jgi:hypothetical protein